MSMGPERKLQVKVTNRAKQEHGALAIKQETGRFGTAGWPDYLLVFPNAWVIFMEFKRPGGRLTPLQAKRQKELAERGIETFTVDDHVYGFAIVDEVAGRKPRRAA